MTDTASFRMKRKLKILRFCDRKEIFIVYTARRKVGIRSKLQTDFLTYIFFKNICAANLDLKLNAELMKNFVRVFSSFFENIWIKKLMSNFLSQRF